MTLRFSLGFAASIVLVMLAAGLASCEETEHDTSPVGTEGLTASATGMQAATVVETFGQTATPASRTPGPGETLWRWGNVTVSVKDDSGIAVSRYIAPPQRNPPEGGPEIDLIRGDSQVGINASTGAVLYRSVAEADQAAMEDVVNSLAVGAADPKRLPWPYTEGSPTSPARLQWGKISYIEPASDAGFVVFGSIGDCGGQTQCPEVDSKFITIQDGNSTAFVAVSNDGKLFPNTTSVLAEDAVPFDRYLETVKLCGSESEC